MKIKALLVAGLLTGFFADASPAAVMLAFDDGVGTADAVTINPGDQFSFDVYLTSTSEQTVGLTYFFIESTVGDVSNPGSGMFTITSRDVTGTPYLELQTPNATFLSGAGAVLSPQNGKDAGGLEPDLTPQLAGTYFVASYTFQTSASLPVGTYVVDFSNAIYVDQDLSSQNFNGLGTYTVTVIPEPGSLLLCLGGLLICIRPGRHRLIGRRPLS